MREHILSGAMDKYKVFANVLEKYKEETFAHLDDMSIDELCSHRSRITKQLKKLEEERREIDENIMSYLSEAELRQGVPIPGGETIKMRSRTSWKYPDEVGIAINDLRRRSRESGQAEELRTTYLVII